MPVGNPGDWITTSDYPSSALRHRIQGIVNFQLSIDAQGRVAACKIIQSSGFDELDAATCDLVSQRAKFSAARDVRGRPTEGRYTNRVRWAIPNAAQLLAPISVKPLLSVDANGNVTTVR
jgi:protein TonB